MTAPFGATVTVSFQEAHEVSVGLLRFFEENEIKVGPAMASLVLTLGRLIGGPKELPDEVEVDFIKSAIDWAGAYFAEGGSN